MDAGKIFLQTLDKFLVLLAVSKEGPTEDMVPLINVWHAAAKFPELEFEPWESDRKKLSLWMKHHNVGAEDHGHGYRGRIILSTAKLVDFLDSLQYAKQIYNFVFNGKVNTFFLKVNGNGAIITKASSRLSVSKGFLKEAQNESVTESTFFLINMMKRLERIS